MKRSFLRTVSAMLLAAMLVSSFACSEKSDEEIKDNHEASSDTAADNEPAEETEFRYIDGIQDSDYEDSAFNIFTTNNLGDRPTTLSCALEQNGEVVNDSLFLRDRWTEDKFKIKIGYIVEDDAGSKILRTVKAGDNAYDLVIGNINNEAKPIITGGSAIPVNEMPGINLDREYWMPDVNADLYLNGRLYFCSSAISPRFYGSAYINVFNRDRATDLGLGNLYDYVTEGTWTLDKLTELSAVAIEDLNNDGRYGDEDQVGYLYEVLTPEVFMIGFDRPYLKNADGALTCMINSEGFSDAIQKLADTLQLDSFTNMDVDRFNLGGQYDEDKVMKTGNYLFFNTCTFNLNDFREVEYDYGVLPMPKYNEQQDHYISNSQIWVGMTPVFLKDLPLEKYDMVGAVTDAFCAYGFDYCRPAVYENVIQLKGTRDEQAALILDDIFSHITIEMSNVYGIDTLYSGMRSFLFDQLGKKDIASVYASLEKSVDRQIKKVVEKYEKNAEG